MQKWEYMFVRIEPSSFEVMSVNFEDMPKPRPNFIEFFNQIGSDGWELVIQWGVIWVFKRPVR